LTIHSSPLVSVVIPTYNHAHFLVAALQSVIDQTYSNWEAIVVDNHSTDNTDTVVQNFNNPRISLLKIHNDGVIAASRNMGIQNAKGEWIAFLDSDDLWYPEKLQIVMDQVKATPSIDIFTTDEMLVNELTGEKSALHYGPSSPNFYKQLLVTGNCLSPSATLVRREFLTSGDILFREKKEFVTAEDYDFWLLLARADAKFKFIRSIQGEYRIHANNHSGKIEKHEQSIGEVIKDHVFNLQAFQPDKERLWRDINARFKVARAKNLFINRQFIAATVELFDACRTSLKGTCWYFFLKFKKKIPF
jgi:glycosyltransferase involved in cell wall biosynthesis